LKFDLQIPEFLQQRADSLTEHITGGVASRPYWIAGSTREGEDTMILSALAKHPLRERALALIRSRCGSVSTSSNEPTARLRRIARW
jgi:3-deoxy-D-manno-octulosonic-acid transferase